VRGNLGQAHPDAGFMPCCTFPNLPRQLSGDSQVIY